MFKTGTQLIEESISLYRSHWKLFLKTVVIFMIPIFIAMAVESYYGVELDDGSISYGSASPLVFTVGILSEFATLFITLGFLRQILNVIRGEGKREIMPLISASKNIIVHAVIASILTGLAVVGGFFLLVVPAFIFAAWFAFSSLILVDEGGSAIDSMKKSKQLVQGRTGHVIWRTLYPMFVFGLAYLLVNAVINLPITAVAQGLNTIAAIIISTSLFTILYGVFIPLYVLPLVLIYLDLKAHPHKEEKTA